MAKKQILIVLSNAVQGREAEYNDWYTNVHLPDVLRVPGLVAAQRYKVGNTQLKSAPPGKWQYAAVYEMESDDPASVMAEIGRRSRTPDMVVSDAVTDIWAYLYEPITPRVTAK